MKGWFLFFLLVLLPAITFLIVQFFTTLDYYLFFQPADIIISYIDAGWEETRRGDDRSNFIRGKNSDLAAAAAALRDCDRWRDDGGKDEWLTVIKWSDLVKDLLSRRPERSVWGRMMRWDVKYSRIRGRLWPFSISSDYTLGWGGGVRGWVEFRHVNVSWWTWSTVDQWPDFHLLLFSFDFFCGEGHWLL